MNTEHALPLCLFWSLFNIILSSTLRYLVVLSSGLPTEILYAIFLCPMRATFLAQLALYHLFIHRLLRSTNRYCPDYAIFPVFSYFLLCQRGPISPNKSKLHAHSNERSLISTEGIRPFVSECFVFLFGFKHIKIEIRRIIIIGCEILSVIFRAEGEAEVFRE